ncbi:hypothetical protein NDI56_20120 [Haloarcula sp. S1CR25-12]|uniref:Uncharacterized protein n=1 Tax=Haloarcula saliterrae TaxID=2950534 RepID=A0ABU2FHH6_9EURY|nr:hypothetical protein [Haloarcula sp. S1CR25-12]MDS0261713.1 hypothetical protein [Haloarcula sp. S1CR25-12]
MAIVAVVVGIAMGLGNFDDWGIAISVVAICGGGLAFLLGAAQNHRQQLFVIGAMVMLGLLFVAAGIYEATISVQKEGIPMMIAIGFTPLAMLVSYPLYHAGAMFRREPANRSHRLLLTAVALPWIIGGFGYFTLQQVLRATQSLYSSEDLFIRSLFDIWPTVGIMMIGAVFVYGVHRARRPDLR